MTPFNKGLAIVAAGAIAALAASGTAYPQGAVTLVQIIANGLAISSTNTLPSSIVQGGNTAAVSIDGALAVNTPANPEFSDFFSSSLDTTVNWTTNNSGGTTATSAGSLVISGTTTLSQYAGLSTKQAWTPSGGSAQLFGVSVSYNTLVVTNSVRIFGVYTSPATPTLAAPITDGYVYRLDATGALFAEVWASGVAVSSTNVSAVPACTPTAGVQSTYYFTFRTNLVQFGCGANPAAATTFVNPTNQTLPISAYSIAGLSAPGSAATMSLSGLILSTYAPATVKTAAQTATINDPAMVVTTSPNSLDPCLNSNVPKSSVPINITSAATTQLVAISGTTSIYVCHFDMTISEVVTTPNTLQFEYGTSTNCTGTNKLTGLYGGGGVTASAPISVLAGYAGTLFTVPSANGLCALTAIGATGSFQGLLTYVQQ